MTSATPPPFPEPTSETADPRTLFARYLHFYRETVIGKAGALGDAELRTSRLRSGWTPLELLNHLAYMERRWVVWGFLGEQVPDPWGDEREGRWRVPDTIDLADVVRALREVGARTADVLAGSSLEDRAARGGRFQEDPPTLASICFHLLQEYARHAGHLDLAVELAGGPLGE